MAIPKMNPQEKLIATEGALSQADLVRRIAGMQTPVWGALRREWSEEPVEWVISIDHDHTCHLTMSFDDYRVLMRKGDR